MAATDGAFLIGATRARAVAQFLERFGHAPARVFRSGRTWRAGPVDEKSPDAAASGDGQSLRDYANSNDELTHVHCTIEDTQWQTTAQST